MGTTGLTYIFCHDEHRSLSEEIKKKFSDPGKYHILLYSSHIELLKSINDTREHRNFKTVIFNLNDWKGQAMLTESLVREIKKADPSVAVILVFPADNQDEIRKVMKFNIDTFIPRNNNTMLRLHNAVKRGIGEHNLRKYRQRRNLALYLLFGVLIMSAILLLFAYYRFPGYF